MRVLKIIHNTTMIDASEEDCEIINLFNTFDEAAKSYKKEEKAEYFLINKRIKLKQLAIRKELLT